MRKIIVSLMLLGSVVAIGTPASAVQVTGTPTYFWTGAYTGGVQCGLIVNGLFYSYTGNSTAMITSIDIARRVKGTISFSADAARVINGAY